MHMLKSLSGLGAVVLLSGAAVAGPSTNLVANGDFEQPALAPGAFQQSATIPGWSGSANVEVQSNGILGGAQGTPFGNQYVELNVVTPSVLSQTISTTPGAQYLLSFYFADRPGTGTNSVAVSVTGSPASNFTLNDTGVVSFQQFTKSFVATSNATVLSFAPIASNIPGEGNLLDNVSVTPAGRPQTVPLPTAMWAGIWGLLGFGRDATLQRQASCGLVTHNDGVPDFGAR